METGLKFNLVIEKAIREFFFFHRKLEQIESSKYLRTSAIVTVDGLTSYCFSSLVLGG